MVIEVIGLIGILFTQSPLRGGIIGTRRARSVNMAMLLTRNYYHLLQAMDGNGDSYSWSFIVNMEIILSLGFIMCVGIGDISILYDKWHRYGRLWEQISYLAQNLSGGCGILIKYPSLFFYDVKMEMESVFTDDESDDTVVWDPSNSGANNTESTYYWQILLP